MTVAFVLSGGGSLGAVQVGMLRALAEHGVAPDLLVGTSAGALNAAWVATHGMARDSLTELGRIWIGLRRSDVFPVDPRSLARGLLGHSPAVASSRNLEQLIVAQLRGPAFADADVPVHVLATDLLSGTSVRISDGSLVRGILASAAIPGVLPPVERDGRLLVDGAIARNAGIEDAVELGASTIYVLPSGTACALPRPPRTAVGVALQSLSLLAQDRLQQEVRYLAPRADIRLLPPLCPLAVSAADFSHAAELMDRALDATLAWIANGGTGYPAPDRFLSAHRHRGPTRTVVRRSTRKLAG